jgi:hypothetical protein
MYCIFAEKKGKTSEQQLKLQIQGKCDTKMSVTCVQCSRMLQGTIIRNKSFPELKR